MINYLHSLLHRPEKGWDPVPSSHAEHWTQAPRDPAIILDQLRGRLGDLSGKSILDLGAGPGHYSVAFAQAGAKVTWFDVSQKYQTIARQRARDANVEIRFELGYLEDAVKLNTAFDLVFLNLCWYYCMNDRGFARIIYSLVTPGGAAYIASPCRSFGTVSPLRLLQMRLNDYTGLKVGHPFAGRGRIADLFNRYPLDMLHADYRDSQHDVILFIKPL